VIQPPGNRHTIRGYKNTSNYVLNMHHRTSSCS